MNIKVVIGLGNPGSKYYKTRHNIGFRVLDALAEKHLVSWQSKQQMELSEIVLDSAKQHHTIFLVKPQTYMNSSGDVAPFLKKQGIKTEEILVVHDELEKRFGAISVKQSGSARGHNGLRSLIERLGDTFWRVRFGIGRPENKADVGDYVLSNFTKQEEEQLPALIEEAVQTIERSILN